jgi:hypothetical protein
MDFPRPPVDFPEVVTDVEPVDRFRTGVGIFQIKLHGRITSLPETGREARAGRNEKRQNSPKGESCPE